MSTDGGATSNGISGATSSPLVLNNVQYSQNGYKYTLIATNASGLLVVTDLFFPGWVAEEGGRRLPILRADGFFRAVALTAGSHRVTFRYRPVSVFLGAGISMAALLTILFLGYQGEPVR